MLNLEVFTDTLLFIVRDWLSFFNQFVKVGSSFLDLDYFSHQSSLVPLICR